jgi:NIPSNAP
MRKLILLAQVALLGLTMTVMTNAQGAGRIYELRTYTCNEGKLPDLLKRFREHTMEIFERHHMHNVGYWIPADESRHSNTLIYIISHESREAAAANWKAFQGDPEWQKVSKASDENGKIVNHTESVFMNPTDFSQLK